MRAVLDTNVLISALLSPTGSPARILLAWRQGHFELVVSPLLLAEMKRALAYRKLQRRIPAQEDVSVIQWLGRAATVVPDPKSPPPVHSADPADDYLLALAAIERAMLASGDEHLLVFHDRLPMHSPASFLTLLGGE